MKKKRTLNGTKNAMRVHLVTLPMSFPSCLLAGPHAIACDLPSFLAARSRVRFLLSQSIGQVTDDERLGWPEVPTAPFLPTLLACVVDQPEPLSKVRHSWDMLRCVLVKALCGRDNNFPK